MRSLVIGAALLFVLPLPAQDSGQGAWDLLRRHDRDGDGKISLDEYTRGAEGRGGGRGAGGRGAGGAGRDRPGAGSERGAGPPQSGELAPDFELPFAEELDRKVRLSSYVGKKPVALIFGSYT